VESWGSYERLVIVSFKIEPSLLYKLNEIAARTRRSRSEIIREALTMYIEMFDGNNNEPIGKLDKPPTPRN